MDADTTRFMVAVQVALRTGAAVCCRAVYSRGVGCRWYGVAGPTWLTSSWVMIPPGAHQHYFSFCVAVVTTLITGSSAIQTQHLNTVFLNSNQRRSTHSSLTARVTCHYHPGIKTSTGPYRSCAVWLVLVWFGLVGLVWLSLDSYKTEWDIEAVA